jgi:stage III sporulation protein SpoIIIAA
MGGVIKGQSELVGALVRRPDAPKTHLFSVDQQSVIDHRGSPLVVLGGPGTGKTTLIIESALSRISQGQDPNSILMLTYGVADKCSHARADCPYFSFAGIFHS